MKKKTRIITEYTHRLGRIIIDQGISDGDYGAYILKDNGSLKRFVPIIPSKNPKIVRMQIEYYKGKALKKDKYPVQQQSVCDEVHLSAGIRESACGLYGGSLSYTVFLSQVTCVKCKKSDLYKQKDKKRKK